MGSGFSLLQPQSILRRMVWVQRGVDERRLPDLAVELSMLRSSLSLGELDGLCNFWLYFFFLSNVSKYCCLQGRGLYICK